MAERLKALFRDERGFTTIEWAALGVIVTAGAVIVGNMIRGGSGAAANTINSKLQNTVNNGSNAANW